MDARRGEVFTALYDVAAPAAGDVLARLTEVEGPMAGPVPATLERWSLAGLPTVLAGDGTQTHAALIPEGTRVPAPGPIAGIVACLAAAMAAAGETKAPAGLQPVYVRRPDVEIARDGARRT
jgi:tRNA A37 threonylcarbamoyladenosine modification protein TsaB